MLVILGRPCVELQPDDVLFKGVYAEHVHSMAMRVGAHKFMLHDLRKLVMTEWLPCVSEISSIPRHSCMQTPCKSDADKEHAG